MTPVREGFKIYVGDALAVLKAMESESFHACITSPPYYGLRDYGVEGQIGLEPTPEEYIEKLVDVFREVHRVLRDDGTLWLNIGDSYAGSGKGRNADGSHQEGGKQGTNRGTVEGSLHKTKLGSDTKEKDMLGVPWMLAFALRADGWYLRSEIIWNKSSTIPESVKDRPTKAHEQIFLLSKSAKYFYDWDAISEPAANVGKIVQLSEKSFSKYQANGAGIRPSGNALLDTYTVPARRNKRSVWTIAPKRCKEAHFAVFPPELPETCLLAGSPHGGVVLDPFSGVGTTGLMALKHGRVFVGIELNPEYAQIAHSRLESFVADPENYVGDADISALFYSLKDSLKRREKSMKVRDYNSLNDGLSSATKTGTQ
jgi:DNA modification methylase